MGKVSDWSTPTTVLQRFGDAMELLCRGNRPSDAMLTSWLTTDSIKLQEFACEHGPSWAQGIGLIDAALTMVDQPTEILTPDNPNGPDHERRT